jgi:hypothetical protein
MQVEDKDGIRCRIKKIPVFTLTFLDFFIRSANFDQLPFEQQVKQQGGTNNKTKPFEHGNIGGRDQIAGKHAYHPVGNKNPEAPDQCIDQSDLDCYLDGTISHNDFQVEYRCKNIIY